MRLRDFAPGDLEPYVQAFAEDSQLGALIGYERDPTPASARRRLRGEDRDRLRGRGVRFAIVTREDDTFAGQIALHSFDWHHRRADCGFFVVAARRGEGLALEALRLVVRWGFSALGLVRVGLATMTDNEGTIRLAERAGFQREGILRAYTYERGRPVDNLVYGAVAGDPAWA